MVRPNQPDCFRVKGNWRMPVPAIVHSKLKRVEVAVACPCSFVLLWESDLRLGVWSALLIRGASIVILIKNI